MGNIRIETKDGVYVDMTELLQFNQDLIRFKNTLNKFLEDVGTYVKMCGHEWKDEKFNEFQKKYEEHTNKLKPLAEELERYKKFSEENWIPIIKEHLGEDWDI